MESLTVKRMSAFLPKNVQIKCLQTLRDTYRNNKQLATDLGWSSLQLEKGLQGNIPEKDVPGILRLSLDNCPAIKNIVKTEVIDEVQRLCVELDITGENKQRKMQQFMQSLQDKDRAVLLHMYNTGHAKLHALTTILRTENDTQTLTRIREVINPIAKNILN